MSETSSTLEKSGELFGHCGDIVEFVKDTPTIPPLQKTPVQEAEPSVVKRGARYSLDNLVGYGWDMTRKTEKNSGPENLRMLDSELPDYVEKV